MPADEPSLHGAAALAAQQDGCVTRQQLLELGFGPERVKSLVRRGVLSLVLRGVYVYGAPALTDAAFLRAGLLYVGAGSFFSEACSAELRGYLPRRVGMATIATARDGTQRTVRTRVPLRETGRPGVIRVRHSDPALLSSLELFRGWLITTVPRTIIDIAGTRDLRLFDRAWREAEYLGLLDASALRAELDRGTRKGAAAVRKRLADKPPVTNADSGLRSRKELRLLHRMILEAGIPAPETDARIVIDGRSRFADFLWRELGLVVEFDGPAHLLPDRVNDDKARDLEFFAIGLDVLRISDRDLKQRIEWCVEMIAAAVARQQRRVAH